MASYPQAGSVRPVQMPTPRMDTNISGIESQAQQRASWASGVYNGGPPAQAPTNSSGPIEINVMPPVCLRSCLSMRQSADAVQSRSESHASSGRLETPPMGSNLFGPGVAAPSIYGPPRATAPLANPPQAGFVPMGFQENRSPMPGSYALPSEGPTNPAGAPYDPLGDNESESTHSSDLQTSTPNTLTTPPELRRPHLHKPPRKKNPAAWPRDPGYERAPKNPTGPGFGYDRNGGSTSGT